VDIEQRLVRKACGGKPRGDDTDNSHEKVSCY
jgi:hypothetical protein